MKALVCTRCNSNELVKQGDEYVCPFCGTQYTDEEIKKMQIEGTVKIDNSDMIERFLQNARRAKAKEDWDETEKYYNLVEQHDPTNVEAIFYSSYGKAMLSLISSDIFKRESVFKTLTKSVSILDDNYDISKEAELRPILEQISADIIAMSDSKFVYTQAQNGLNKTETLFNQLNSEFVTTIQNILAKFPNDEKQNVTYLYEIIVEHCKKIYNHVYGNAIEQSWLDLIIKTLTELHSYDKSEKTERRIEYFQNLKTNREKINKKATLILSIIALIVSLGICAAVFIPLLCD
ncbi:MAG: hypothetical protein II225_04035 [Ruminococcus sp.]|nr:hypothetical protein [Ruminococcus sp.]